MLCRVIWEDKENVKEQVKPNRERGETVSDCQSERTKYLHGDGLSNGQAKSLENGSIQV